MKLNLYNKNHIGVFDSGIGGLTVVHSLFELLPNENITYFGDTARLPYGTKSKETIIQYSTEIAKFLLSKNVKLIVVACNTASSVALPKLRKISPVPIIGVIEPGSKAAVDKTKSKKIGVIGTFGTIHSNSYKKKINKFSNNIKVYSRPCSLFVQLAEDGWIDNKISYLIAEEYLKDFKKEKIDTLILGCTHYPLLKRTIGKVLGNEISLIDSGEETAKEVKRILEVKKLLNPQRKEGIHKFFVSDFPNKFQEISKRFLGNKIQNVKKIRLKG